MFLKKVASERIFNNEVSYSLMKSLWGDQHGSVPQIFLSSVCLSVHSITGLLDTPSSLLPVLHVLPCTVLNWWSSRGSTQALSCQRSYGVHRKHAGEVPPKFLVSMVTSICPVRMCGWFQRGRRQIWDQRGEKKCVYHGLYYQWIDPHKYPTIHFSTQSSTIVILNKLPNIFERILFFLSLVALILTLLCFPAHICAGWFSARTF